MDPFAPKGARQSFALALGGFTGQKVLAQKIGVRSQVENCDFLGVLKNRKERVIGIDAGKADPVNVHNVVMGQNRCSALQMGDKIGDRLMAL